MSYLKIIDENDKPKGTVRIVDGRLEATGLSADVLNEMVVVQDGTGEQLGPDDGDEYLEALGFEIEDYGWVAELVEDKISEAWFGEAIARPKDDDEWIPYSHARGGGRGIKPMGRGQRLRILSAKPASAVPDIQKYREMPMDRLQHELMLLEDAKRSTREMYEGAKTLGYIDELPRREADMKLAELDYQQALNTWIARRKRGEMPLDSAPPARPLSATGPGSEKMLVLDTGVPRQEVPVEPNPILRSWRSGTALDEGEITGKTYLSGTANDVYKGQLPDGRTVYVKPWDGLSELPYRSNIPVKGDIERELAASVVNKHLDLVRMPEQTVREVKNLGLSLVSEEVPGDPGTSFRTAPMEQVRGMALFDAVIGNTDRHPGNYLVDDSGTSETLYSIDHGLSFPVIHRGDGDGNTAALTYLYADANPHRARAIEQRISYHKIPPPPLEPAEVTKLQSFVANRVLIDGELVPLVGESATQSMWDRVMKMLETTAYPDPYAMLSGNWIEDERFAP